MFVVKSAFLCFTSTDNWHILLFNFFWAYSQLSMYCVIQKISKFIRKTRGERQLVS
jgi:hypothetical protein